jgi:hypothetical protein
LPPNETSYGKNTHFLSDHKITQLSPATQLSTQFSGEMDNSLHFLVISPLYGFHSDPSEAPGSKVSIFTWTLVEQKMGGLPEKKTGCNS